MGTRDPLSGVRAVVPPGWCVLLPLRARAYRARSQASFHSGRLVTAECRIDHWRGTGTHAAGCLPPVSSLHPIPVTSRGPYGATRP